MRHDFSRWILLFLLIILFESIPLGIAQAAGGDTWFDDPYPTPNFLAALEEDIDIGFWLIIGAAVIVVVIFLGAVLRRKNRG